MIPHVKTVGNSSKGHVLLLHGWGRSSADLLPLGELLADDYQAHVVDLAGHGESQVPETPWGMAEYAKSITDYMDANGISSAHLIGHSFGGKTILKIAASTPERVLSLTLIGSSGVKPRKGLVSSFRTKTLNALRSAIKMVDGAIGTDIFKQWYVPKFASADYLSAGPMLKTFVKSVNEHLDSELSSVKSPALLIWGEKDSETPLYMGQEMYKLIPDSKLIVIPGQGHYLLAGAGANACALHVKRFLKSIQQSEGESCA